ncbi:MAG: hypothetical protein JO273_08925 [Methylobacteriaceae bacterium]|nr:hypothetical protein [Methylobacteriaceae bacterium]
MQDVQGQADNAASAITFLSPRVRSLPPPGICFVVPNGCSTVHRLTLIRLESA